MVKRCEPLLNVVTESKPKVLRSFPKKLVGLGQNGKGTRLGAPNSPSADEVPPAKRRNLTHLNQVLSGNVLSPLVSLWGKQAARRADGPAGKGGRKKRKPTGNELDRG